MPKPRTQISNTTLGPQNLEKPSPNRKKPIPQPRTGPAVPGPTNKSKQSTSPQKNTLKSLKNLLPDKPAVQPVPTAEFQSFRRVHPTSPSSLPPAPTHPESAHPVKTRKAKVTTEPNPTATGAAMPEYVNTTPPAVPARNATAAAAGQKNPSRTGSRSEILQQAKKPSSRRFSGAGLVEGSAAVTAAASSPSASAQRPPLLGKIPRGSSVEATSMSSVQSSSGGSFDGGAVSPTRSPLPPHPSVQQQQNMTTPYCVTDIVDRSRIRPTPPPPPPPSSSVHLPPVFTPQTYNLQEMHQQRSSAQGIRRQMATNPSMSTDASFNNDTEDTH